MSRYIYKFDLCLYVTWNMNGIDIDKKHLLTTTNWKRVEEKKQHQKALLYKQKIAWGQIKLWGGEDGEDHRPNYKSQGLCTLKHIQIYNSLKETYKDRLSKWKGLNISTCTNSRWRRRPTLSTSGLSSLSTCKPPSKSAFFQCDPHAIICNCLLHSPMLSSKLQQLLVREEVCRGSGSSQGKLS